MQENEDVAMIPISAINILNPRCRNKQVFAGIVENIGKLGLKKPVVVSRLAERLGDKDYDLICGQGRIEAYVALGLAEIPCIVIESAPEERYLMSLVENIARRHRTPVELVREITNLRDRGYSSEQISAKLALDRTYISSIQHLLDHGEARLVSQVEQGRIPLGLAVRISTGAEEDLQAALREAYTRGELNGRQLVAVKQFLARRRQKKCTRPLSPQAIVRAYRRFTAQQQSLAKRAARTERQMLIIVTAMKQLLGDHEFIALLRVEGLDTMPALLAERISKG